MSTEETIPQMRDRIDAQNKQLSGLRKQNQELRTVAAESTFEAAGYNPKHAALFVTQTAEAGTIPTSEVVEAFAGEWDLAKVKVDKQEQSGESSEPVEAEEQDAPQRAPGSALDPMSRSGSSTGAGAGGAGSEAMTRQEWIQLSKTDKAAAENALRQGRVQLSGDTPVVGNPYDQQ